MTDKSDKTALITGASSGLGFEYAQQLAALGYNLILIARREDRLEQLNEGLQSKYNIEVLVFPADLSQISEIEAVVSLIKNRSDIDLLVNNAGFGIMRRFMRADPDQELALLQVHMTAPVMLCRAALDGMVKRNRGAIINVASLAGIIPIRSVLYGSSKSFLVSFSEALQEELCHTQIHIQALCPGFILTEFHDTPFFTNFKRERIPQFLWMKPDKVVSDSLHSLKMRKVIVIPGKFYNLVGMLAQNSLTAGIIKMAARFVLRRRR